MDNMVTVLEPLQTSLLGSITPTQIVVLLASIIGVGMTFVLMWFGVRKLVSIFKDAVFKGKMTSLSSGSFSYSGGDKDRETYKKLLSWEHSKGIHHSDDEDFI